MKRKYSRFSKNGENGVAIIEFALVLLFILFPLIVGLIDFGHLFKHKQVLSNAAREAVREAVKGGNSDLNKIVRDYYEKEIPPDDQFATSVDSPIYNPDKVVGAEVTVTVREAFQFLILPGSLFPNITQLTATAIMRYQ